MLDLFITSFYVVRQAVESSNWHSLRMEFLLFKKEQSFVLTSIIAFIANDGKNG
jgi:hypothetical protein